MAKKQGHSNRYGMVIDLDKCTGCGTCMVACASENNVTVRTDESDKERPPTATKLDPNTGIVSQIYTRCIGCRYCQAACPYEARYFNWWDGFAVIKPFSKGMERSLSPEVSPRMRGVVEKCTFCHHRLMRAKTQAYAEDRRDLEEDEYITACTEACPAQAITFGDLNNPEHEVSRLVKSPYAFRLLARLHTKPKVYYISIKDWVRKKADNYLPDEFKPILRTSS
jgi:molybdopterin-containing oxidoreductase family iron-sulfur binding subunit